MYTSGKTRTIQSGYNHILGLYNIKNEDQLLFESNPHLISPPYVKYQVTHQKDFIASEDSSYFLVKWIYSLKDQILGSASENANDLQIAKPLTMFCLRGLKKNKSEDFKYVADFMTECPDMIHYMKKHVKKVQNEIRNSFSPTIEKLKQKGI